ncbi:MAG: stage II sporulation protein E [Bacteroidetes bacterium GWA2_31_9b]|nr:MAG: stage II sporulation protein E [Bacteroidetes bacterium GWA2_31_9b]
MENKFYIEVDCQQKNHEGERICGDVFLSERIKTEGRTIVVLSDGMGHGIKANMLATLTATMALNFTKEHKDVNRIAEIIMNTLPVCSQRRISYSTFTIIDIETTGKTTILEYDNPNTLIFRDNKNFDPEWKCIILQSEKNAGKELRSCTFDAQLEDRLIFCSDGITQSGLGSDKYPFGWGIENLETFTKRLITNDPKISAYKLSGKVVNIAYQNDGYHAKDDSSCGLIYFREPRKLLICTGPPYEEDRDKILAEEVKNFEGKKILCGATTGDIISRELDLKITDSFEFDDPDLPPISYMPGIDLVTEGILTLSKVSEILKVYNNNYLLGKGPADQIVKLIKDSDEINFIIGTRINIAHQDPNLPVELEIRRTVVKRIAKTLEQKFLKEVSLKFI